MQVAVPRVPEDGHGQAVLLADGAQPPHRFGDGAPRDGDVLHQHVRRQTSLRGQHGLARHPQHRLVACVLREVHLGRTVLPADARTGFDLTGSPPRRHCRPSGSAARLPPPCSGPGDRPLPRRPARSGPSVPGRPGRSRPAEWR